MPDAPRPIALLTHPGAGQGRGARARAVALPRLRDAGLEVLDLVGGTAEEAAGLGRAGKALAEEVTWDRAISRLLS